MVTIMKKLIAVISMTSIIISCLAGCSSSDKPAEFDDLESLAISAALSYRTLAQNEIIDTDTPEFAWNTAGWYAAYKANLEFSDAAVLSEERLEEIQNVMLTEKAAATPPDTVNAESKVIDGKNCWSFPSISESFHSYLGVTSEVNCEKAEENAFTVTIRDHLRFNVVEETVFNVRFEKKNDGYKLSELSRSEFYDLDFTPELLHDANLLSNLFSIYDNLTITEDYLNGAGVISCSEKTDSGYAFWCDDGSVGYYNEYRFYTNDSGSVSVMPVGAASDWLDDYVANMMLPNYETDFIRLTCTEDEEIFYIDYGYSSTVYTIDRGTLALKAIEAFDDNNESYYMVKFSYGEALSEPYTIAAWKKPLRNVTINQLYADGTNFSETFTIPSDWELYACEYCRWGTVYLDDEYTEPYVYPGDGINYTLFACEGVG